MTKIVKMKFLHSGQSENPCKTNRQIARRYIERFDTAVARPERE
jgi:hypothetical protein